MYKHYAKLSSQTDDAGYPIIQYIFSDGRMQPTPSDPLIGETENKSADWNTWITNYDSNTTYVWANSAITPAVWPLASIVEWKQKIIKAEYDQQMGAVLNYYPGREQMGWTIVREQSYVWHGLPTETRVNLLTAGSPRFMTLFIQTLNDVSGTPSDVSAVDAWSEVIIGNAQRFEMWYAGCTRARVLAFNDITLIASATGMSYDDKAGALIAYAPIWPAWPGV